MPSGLAISQLPQWGTGLRTSSRPMTQFLFAAFIVGLPAWWALGTSFMMPAFLAAALIFFRPSAHRHFTLSDCVLAGIILVLVTSAYVNGFLLSGEPLRFLAALYNASIWVCGLILVQQLRPLLQQSDRARTAILRAGFVGFAVLAALAWGSFIFAYAVHNFDHQILSLLGALIGDKIPDSAVLIKQSTTMVFTKADWGLPGIPMPRIGIYGPYPNSTAAVTAALGTMALLYQHVRGRDNPVRGLALEVMIVATLVISLSRATLVGWLLGALLANLIFGSSWRRMLCYATLVCALLVPIAVDIGNVGSYRQYSTESRFDNYWRAFDETLQTSPVLGMGIKPREEISHIAVGSHSTFVSAFTKGGALGLALTFAYLVILPGLHWIRMIAAPSGVRRRMRDQMRILLTMQTTLWAWMTFEDLDAPATAAILIFMVFALIENLTKSQPAPLPEQLR